MFSRLYVGNQMIGEGTEYGFWKTLAEGVEGAQLVVLQQQATEEERRAYRIVAWLAKRTDAGAVEISMEFGLSLGGTFKVLTELEKAGLITSQLETVNSKQVRMYRRS